MLCLKRMIPRFRWKHTLLVIFFLMFLTFIEIIGGGIRIFDNPNLKIDPFEKYGTLGTYLLYALKIATFVTIPFTFINIFGILLYDTFPDRPQLQMPLYKLPYICVRIVTRGDCADLVRKNVQKIVDNCQRVGLDNFIIEVVTDKPMSGYAKQLLNRVKEIVVPDTYSCKNGTLYKARALQYCLEDSVSDVDDQAWIVHLDEETLMTESSIIGILNFIHQGNGDLGQGVITYANEEIVNWNTTLADCIRVSIDHGQLRLTFNLLHKPLFSWKGSFVVVKAAIEKEITFDNGPQGSIAEDCFFAMKAYARGYNFGFIEGEMWEKSTFTVMDFLKQRRRWAQGLYLALRSSQIPLSCKCGLFFIVVSSAMMPVTTLSAILGFVFPTPQWQILDVLFAFMGASFLFLFIFGSMKSFSVERLGVCKFIFRIICTLLNLPFVLVMENIAAVWAILSSKTSFHVVQKNEEDIKRTAVISKANGATTQLNGFLKTDATSKVKDISEITEIV